MAKKKFFAIGIMSGTSLDGLDISYCSYSSKKKKWTFKFYKGETLAYDKSWKEKLGKAHELSGENLMKLHAEFGHWTGHAVKEFIKRNKISKVDLISSHGHTVFHQPKSKLTFQLGDGNAIYSIVDIPVVYDFRSLDVHLGGQGAPLVPIGDRFLFSDYDVCLNLGGIANLSMELNEKRIAFDVCFCNMGLNYLMNFLGKDFDDEGSLSGQGRINEQLLAQLNSCYASLKSTRPALAREHFEQLFLPLLCNDQLSIEDRLRTFSESIALQVSDVIQAKKKIKKVLVTGGGARNKFLISLLRKGLKPKKKIVIPENHSVEFKEAIVFGFLGVLRKLNRINVLKSVTQSKRDSVSGVMVS